MRGSGNVTVLEWGCQLLGNLWRVSENSPLPVPLAELAPFVPLLANLVAAPEQDESVVRSALAALADFGRLCMDAAQGTDADRDVLVECGAVASLKALLESAEPSLKCVASLTAYVISAGSFEHRQAVIDGDLVPLLVDVAASGETELELKEMAARTVGNIAGGVQQQTEYVVECGGIQPLCDLLQASTEDLMGLQSTLLVLYKTLRAGRQKQANEGLPDNPYCTLLEQAGGVDKIVELQTHNDMNIAAQASLFLLNRFPARVDLHRLEALFEAGVIQVGPVHPGGGGDDQATHVGDDNSDGDSDIAGEGNGAVDGHLQGDSGEEER
uniref:Importin subunit alpha n=1 Tax=Vitrella brassicaformis TaxID=1169539 RepID=A0A7S1K7Y3_9ALVE